MNNNIRKMNMKSKLIIIIFVPENLILALEFWGGVIILLDPQIHHMLGNHKSSSSYIYSCATYE